MCLLASDKEVRIHFRCKPGTTYDTGLRAPVIQVSLPFVEQESGGRSSVVES